MSQIRKAHSVEIIDRRLRDCEMSGRVDVMELVGLHDELARVERKWLAKAADEPRAGARARPLADGAQINSRFDRLKNMVEAALRQPGEETAERRLLRQVAEKLRERKALKVST